MFGGMIALFITLVAIGIISFITITNGSQFRRLFPVIGAATMFAGFGTLMCVAVKSKISISTGLRNVCDETSARHPGVSFHVRYEAGLWSSPCFGRQHHNLHVSIEEYIIEVNVADATNNNVGVPTGTATIAHAIPVPSPTKTKTNYDPQTVLAFGSGEERKSPAAAERMKELDEMKNLLTEGEYQRKRAEIMSDV